ncbi:MAG: glutathione S-transferase family protein [Thiothrix sp.]|nr:glutathione S-transferase family protein [Thiothrix sp.]HPE61785.1 glutathione S-transferase family protein [Thiolinea sp.]
MHLYIAYKNYSSWSLRPWLLMKVAGITFEETLFPFDHSDALERFADTHRIPPQVPVLIDAERVVWDSLAIMEYLAEHYPDRLLWPQDAGLRALARCAAAEMHSGFQALRSQHPMNCRASRQVTPGSAVQQDLKRLKTLWELFEQAGHPAGAFLCGPFGIVDAMYAPVMWRVTGYGLSVSEPFARWCKAMQALPAMQEWLASARAEQWQLAQYERIGETQP